VFTRPHDGAIVPYCFRRAESPLQRSLSHGCSFKLVLTDIDNRALRVIDFSPGSTLWQVHDITSVVYGASYPWSSGQRPAEASEQQQQQQQQREGWRGEEAAMPSARSVPGYQICTQSDPRTPSSVLAPCAMVLPRAIHEEGCPDGTHLCDGTDLARGMVPLHLPSSHLSEEAKDIQASLFNSSFSTDLPCMSCWISSAIFHGKGHQDECSKEPRAYDKWPRHGGGLASGGWNAGPARLEFTWWEPLFRIPRGRADERAASTKPQAGIVLRCGNADGGGGQGASADHRRLCCENR